MFLAESPRFISQIISSNPQLVNEVLLGSDIAFDVPEGITVRIINDSLVKDLSTDKSSQKVFASVSMPEQYIKGVLPDDPGNGILLMENVQDPGNVGTLIRSAVAFGFSGILMDNNSADPFSPKAVHSAAGSILAPWILRTDDIYKYIDLLKSKGYRLIVSDLKGDEVDSLHSIESMILVMGNEGNGVSDRIRDLADLKFKIPMNDRAVESLNVGAAGAVAMYMAKRL